MTPALANCVVKLSARDIQRRLIAERYRRNFVMPNYTPLGWFECDVFELTEAGFFREYEIKLSRSDFKADADKAKQRWDTSDGKWEKLPPDVKHDLLAKASPKGPSRFYFVTPEGLITADEVPLWAGLIHAWPYRDASSSHPIHSMGIRTIKEAPVLHRSKSDPMIKRKACETCYWRMHNLLLSK